ncbi:28887_t:CDS:1, partial [Dentiscutata erythropus]
NQIKQENKTLIDEKIQNYFNAILSHTYSHYSKLAQYNMNNSNYINTLPLISLQSNDEELSKNAIC